MKISIRLLIMTLSSVIFGVVLFAGSRYFLRTFERQVNINSEYEVQIGHLEQGRESLKIFKESLKHVVNGVVEESKINRVQDTLSEVIEYAPVNYVDGAKEKELKRVLAGILSKIGPGTQKNLLITESSEAEKCLAEFYSLIVTSKKSLRLKIAESSKLIRLALYWYLSIFFLTTAILGWLMKNAVVKRVAGIQSAICLFEGDIASLMKIELSAKDEFSHLEAAYNTLLDRLIEAQRLADLEKGRSLQNSKLASLGEMSAGIAHEINNPLGVIVGSLGVLKKVKDDPEKFDAKINSIERSAFRIEKIVRGLKKFSRTGTNAPHKPEDVSAIISESLVITEAKLKRHSVELRSQIEDRLAISCDSVEIEQVIVNLINNAADAVKTLDSKWVEISAKREDQIIVLRVTDAGPGIPPEIEQKLFQPFFTTKPVGEGTGLGLSIIKGILEQHKATIQLDRSCKNTCFEIRFPAAEQQLNVA